MATEENAAWCDDPIAYEALATTTVGVAQEKLPSAIWTTPKHFNRPILELHDRPPQASIFDPTQSV